MANNKSSNSEHTQIDHVLHNSLYGHLACSLDNKPYVIPISYGYDGKFIYFHTSQHGRKIEIILKNPTVCMAFEHNVAIKPNSDLACKWSFSYHSVLIEGFVEELRNPIEKSSALSHIMAHYSEREWHFPPGKINQTRVWKMTPHEIHFKTS